MGAAWRDHGVTAVVALLVLPLVSALAYRWRRAVHRPRTAERRARERCADEPRTHERCADEPRTHERCADQRCADQRCADQRCADQRCADQRCADEPRTNELKHGAKRRWAAAEVGLVAGSLPWVIMLFTPQPAQRSVDLVPLHDLPSWLSGDLGTAAAQITGNLLVLAALGFFLPMRVAWAASLARVAGVAVVTSGVIEALQWVFAIGRVSSIDDVLVNTLGAVLAAAASRRWWQPADDSTRSMPGSASERARPRS